MGATGVDLDNSPIFSHHVNRGQGCSGVKDKRVVITGGAGFIGSNIAEELASDNEVVIIDDLSTGHLRNIEHLVKLTNVRFIQGSVTDLPLLHQAFDGVDCVFHQAALASVPLSIEDPGRANEVNATGTLKVLLSARDRKVKKVICASSCAVYGDTAVLPAREDLPLTPLSPYAVTKATGELYCQVFQQVYGLPTVCLRYFNVFGPRQDPGSQYAAVVPKFITAALQNSPLTIFGDGKQTRDFVFVKDVVAANTLAAETTMTGVFNVASGQQTSVNELADLVLKLTARHVAITYQPPRPGDISQSVADVSRVKQFGYNPKHSIEEGIEKTIFSIQASRIS